MQIQRRHRPLPPQPLPCLLPVHDQCKSQVTTLPTVLSNINSEDQPKSILKQSLCTSIYARNSRNKTLSTTSEKFLVLKTENTLDNTSYSSYLGMHAFSPGTTVLARKSADETTCRHHQSALSTNRSLQIKSLMCNYASSGSCSPVLAIEKQDATY